MTERLDIAVFCAFMLAPQFGSAGGDVDPGDLDANGAVTGDWSCKSPLRTLQPGGPRAVGLSILDYETDEAVAGAAVQVWEDDASISGDAAWDGPTDESGQVTVPDDVIRACVPFTVLVTTDGTPQVILSTYSLHLVAADTPSGSLRAPALAYSTYNLLPLTVGVLPEPTRGLVSGRVIDCGSEPIVNGEVSLGTLDRDGGTVIDADGYSVRYFSAGGPDGGENSLTSDGRYLAINVSPDQDLTALLWGIPQDLAHCERTDGGDVIRPAANAAMCLLALAPVRATISSVALSDIALDPYPDSCSFSGDSTPDDSEDPSGPTTDCRCGSRGPGSPSAYLAVPFVGLLVRRGTFRDPPYRRAEKQCPLEPPPGGGCPCRTLGHTRSTGVRPRPPDRGAPSPLPDPPRGAAGASIRLLVEGLETDPMHPDLYLGLWLAAGVGYVDRAERVLAGAAEGPPVATLSHLDAVADAIFATGLIEKPLRQAFAATLGKQPAGSPALTPGSGETLAGEGHG